MDSTEDIYQSWPAVVRLGREYSCSLGLIRVMDEVDSVLLLLHVVEERCAGNSLVARRISVQGSVVVVENTELLIDDI